MSAPPANFARTASADGAATTQMSDGPPPAKVARTASADGAELDLDALRAQLAQTPRSTLEEILLAAARTGQPVTSALIFAARRSLVLGDLPEELLTNVLRLLPLMQRGRATAVCRQWRTLRAVDLMWTDMGKGLDPNGGGYECMPADVAAALFAWLPGGGTRVRALRLKTGQTETQQRTVELALDLPLHLEEVWLEGPRVTGSLFRRVLRHAPTLTVLAVPQSRSGKNGVSAEGMSAVVKLAPRLKALRISAPLVGGLEEWAAGSLPLLDALRAASGSAPHVLASLSIGEAEFDTSSHTRCELLPLLRQLGKVAPALQSLHLGCIADLHAVTAAATAQLPPLPQLREVVLRGFINTFETWQSWTQGKKPFGEEQLTELLGLLFRLAPNLESLRLAAAHDHPKSATKKLVTASPFPRLGAALHTHPPPCGLRAALRRIVLRRLPRGGAALPARAAAAPVRWRPRGRRR
ncbi:hypothetical protein T492DRAFT_966564 [Pavlovales sp. CCMP2436]|nr:hypothetical protein T492DRAFT_966564 [Pavlovales sp. CCMP2436]